MAVESTRLAMLKQISDYLSNTVTEDNGYPNTLSGRIFRGRLVYGADDPLPMISILEGVDQDMNSDVVGDTHNTRKESWPILFQGWAKDDKNNPTDPAHDLMASVKKALALLNKEIRERNLNGTPLENVTRLLTGPGVVRPPENPNNVAFFWLKVVLQHSEDVEDPFWPPQPQ